MLQSLAVYNEDFTTTHVTIDTPIFKMDIDIPQTFSQRLDVQVEGATFSKQPKQSHQQPWMIFGITIV